VRISDNKLHSYRIIAVNDGGRSFPSEVLSVGEASASKGDVLVVNGFTRVSAPDWFDSGERAGFDDSCDHGVAYMQQINYLGSQYEFRRSLKWRDDDAPGFGACRSDHETEVIAGNTFDYPAMHGEALMAAGYSFVSCSQQSFEENNRAGHYKALDLILGKQKETIVGRGAVPSRFKIYTPGLMDAVTAFTQAGGSVMVTGSYVGSEIWNRDNVDDTQARFVKDVLGFQWLNGRAALDGKVNTVACPNTALSAGGNWSFVQQLNDKMYAVESPDAIKASDSRGFTWLRYSENNLPAGVASDRSGYRTVAIGFPLETVTDASSRASMMRCIMSFLDK